MLASLIGGLLSGETLAAIQRARRAAVYYLLAALAGFLAVLFFLVAAYLYAAQRYGAIEAALGFGAGFTVLALLVLLLRRLTSGVRRRRAAERRSSELTTIGVAAALAVLPTLLKGRAGIGMMAAPLAAFAAYMIYRENTRPRPPPDRPE